MKRRKKRRSEIYPDEILIDSSNLPAFDRDQFEGRIERPLQYRSFVWAGGVVLTLLLALLVRAADLQILKGEAYAQQAAENKLQQSVRIADRGAILDRTGVPLAWSERGSIEEEFSVRRYASSFGIAHVVGYAKPPAKDSSGVYFRDSYEGVDGTERVFDHLLSGSNGLLLTETDARGTIVSRAQIREPVPGGKVVLSIDAKVSEGLYKALAARAQESRFGGGAAVLMDVAQGEIRALVNYPEYTITALAEGETKVVEALRSDPREPFLNRATSGLYAPGSIVKPFIATGALTEGVIDEYTKILSTGSISVPNPYDPERPSVFKDWRAHGWVDMRHALAVSSDVYFYEIGGGFGTQRGLGIGGINIYLRFFGFGASTGLPGFGEQSGTIPTPLWKEREFSGDPWRVGDTYNTAIGQYGLQVTPLQAARATAAVANGGRLFVPTLLASSTPIESPLPISPYALQVVREGMRLAVTEGTATAVNSSYIKVGAKTGTAQAGTRNQYINSWIIGFFPYEKPRYAFAMVLERAPAGTLTGAPAAMGAFLEWLRVHAPEYLE